MYVVWIYYLYYHYTGKNARLSNFLQRVVEVLSLEKLNASYVMSATDFPSLCKDKNNLANNVRCELNFLQM